MSAVSSSNANAEAASAELTLLQKLAQNVPGQLGKLTRRMAEAGVNIEVLYSDHANQLILVVDNPAKGRAVAAAWMAERRS